MLEIFLVRSNGIGMHRVSKNCVKLLLSELQWRTEEGVRTFPLAYDLRNKRVRMRQNMVFSTKKYEKFSGEET